MRALPGSRAGHKARLRPPRHTWPRRPHLAHRLPGKLRRQPRSEARASPAPRRTRGRAGAPLGSQGAPARPRRRLTQHRRGSPASRPRVTRPRDPRPCPGPAALAPYPRELRRQPGGKEREAGAAQGRVQPGRARLSTGKSRCRISLAAPPPAPAFPRRRPARLRSPQHAPLPGAMFSARLPPPPGQSLPAPAGSRPPSAPGPGGTRTWGCRELPPLPPGGPGLRLRRGPGASGRRRRRWRGWVAGRGAGATLAAAGGPRPAEADGAAARRAAGRPRAAPAEGAGPCRGPPASWWPRSASLAASAKQKVIRRLVI